MWGILNNFLKTFSEKMWGFYKNYEAFWRHLQRNGSFIKRSEAFSKITRLFEDIFNGIEAFWSAFQKIYIIYRSMEVFTLYFRTFYTADFSWIVF
jgi:hypothetical protein